MILISILIFVFLGCIYKGCLCIFTQKCILCREDYILTVCNRYHTYNLRKKPTKKNKNTDIIMSYMHQYIYLLTRTKYVNIKIQVYVKEENFNQRGFQPTTTVNKSKIGKTVSKYILTYLCNFYLDRYLGRQVVIPRNFFVK